MPGLGVIARADGVWLTGMVEALQLTTYGWWGWLTTVE